MTHALHQLAEVGPSLGHEVVASMAEVVEVDAAQAGDGKCLGPGSAPEVAVPEQMAVRGREHERVGARSYVGIEMVLDLSNDGAGQDDTALACGGLRRREDYPAEWAAGTPIEQPDRVRGGVYALIEDPHGLIWRQIARSVDDLVARMPTHEEAVELRLPAGVPVLRVLRTVLDSNDLPVEVQDSVMAADRHELRYEEQMR